jgi:3-oxoacyl-[acyl-carrier protein] reductase
MTDKTSKVAIVTGASRGIGAAVAERLAADGFTVVINYSGDTKSAEALARKIEGKGGRALTARADVSEPQAVRGMFDTTEAAFGGVDVLVNNAGIMKLARIADSDDALFDQQIAVNLKGNFNAMREAARRLRNGGRIVKFLDQRRRDQARDLRRLCRDQIGGGNHDGDPVQGTARTQHHGQRGRSRTHRDRPFSERQIA